MRSQGKSALQIKYRPSVRSLETHNCLIAEEHLLMFRKKKKKKKKKRKEAIARIKKNLRTVTHRVAGRPSREAEADLPSKSVPDCIIERE